MPRNKKKKADELLTRLVSAAEKDVLAEKLRKEKVPRDYRRQLLDEVMPYIEQGRSMQSRLHSWPRSDTCSWTFSSRPRNWQPSPAP